MSILLSFPTEQACNDPYCPAAEYVREHTHTVYTTYEIPSHLAYDGIDEITCSEIALSVRPNEIAPANSMKGALQNV